MFWRGHWRAVGSALSVLLVGPTACSHAASPTAAPAVAGEIIVHFARGSAAAEDVSRAAAQPTPDTGSIQRLAQRLGDEVGTQLRVDRLGSGGMVIMRIDAAAVRERVASALTSPNAFPGATVESEARGGERVDLVVRPAETLPSDADVDARLDRAGDTAHVPLRGHPAAGGTVAVRIDWNELTRTVAEALRHQPSVSDVELNAVMFPYAPKAD